MLNLNGCGDRVDVDQLLHISLICVPQVVLASHAKFSQKCEKVEKKIINVDVTCHRGSHHWLQGDKSHLWRCMGRTLQSRHSFGLFYVLFMIIYDYICMCIYLPEFYHCCSSRSSPYTLKTTCKETSLTKRSKTKTLRGDQDKTKG